MNDKMHQAWHFAIHLISANRKGHGIHSPFAYELCEEVFYNKAAFYVFNKLSRIRKGLLKDPRSLSISDYGAGSRTFKGAERKVADIAAKGISTQKQSEILFRLINHLQLQNCLELGTSLGLNALYIASVSNSQRVTTIEGSAALCSYAKALAERHKIGNIRFVNARFEEVLEKCLSEQGPPDLVYFDGHHSYEATLRYFHTALQHRHNRTVFAFDDIYWSKGMTKAWNEIKNHPQVRLSIDTFFTGFVFFRSEIKEKINLKFLL